MLDFTDAKNFFKLTMRLLSLVWSWIWEFVKGPGGLLVLFGVAGELVFEYTKWVKDKDQRDRLKRTCGLILVLGLVIEIPESARIRDRAAHANERAANAEKSAAALGLQLENERSNNIVLRLQLRDGELPMGFWTLHTYPEALFHRNESLETALSHIPKQRVILIHNPDFKATFTAIKLATAFTNVGWSVDRQVRQTPCLGVLISVQYWFQIMAPDLRSRIPSYDPCLINAIQLFQVLTEKEVPAQFGEPEFYSDLPTNSVLVVVGERPPLLESQEMVLRAKSRLTDFEDLSVLLGIKTNVDFNIQDRRREIRNELMDLEQRAKNLRPKPM